MLQDLSVRPREPFRTGSSVLLVSQRDGVGGVIGFGKDRDVRAFDGGDFKEPWGPGVGFLDLGRGSEVEDVGYAKGVEGLDAGRGDLGGLGAAVDEGVGSGGGSDLEGAEIVDYGDGDEGGGEYGHCSDVEL